MHQDELPTSMEALREFALNAYRQLEAAKQEAAIAKQEITVAKQQAAAATQEITVAKHEVADAQQKLAIAEQKVAVAKQQAVELISTVTTQKKQLERSERTIRELLQALRGKKRERVDANQLLLFDIGELEQLIEEQAAAAREARSNNRRKRSQARRVIPDNLPQREVIHELPEDERLCPIDGQPMQPIRYETSRQLDYEPAKLTAVIHKRAVYACCTKHDEATLVTAPKPPEAVDKCLATPGLLAGIVVGKFGDHLPGYRMEDILSRSGVTVNRSTLYGWMSAVADAVLPVYLMMVQRVLQSKVIHTDDTSVKLIDHSVNGTRTARIWAYLGDQHHPYDVYDFTSSRERAGPQKFLEGFRGYLQADAYGGYDGIYLNSGGAIVEVACWAHCRRYWHKARDQDPARAHHALAIISRLYEVERGARDADSATRQALRVEHARPLLETFRAWLDEQVFLPKSLIGQAARYTLNQWQALNRYIEDGDLSIDNNAAERAMKPPAIGRKNWLFVGSEAAGHRSAVLMSLIASCKRNHVEPWAWLRDVLEQLPLGAALESLLPNHWLTAHPQHRWQIADRRREEREQKAAAANP